MSWLEDQTTRGDQTDPVVEDRLHDIRLTSSAQQGLMSFVRHSSNQRASPTCSQARRKSHSFGSK